MLKSTDGEAYASMSYSYNEETIIEYSQVYCLFCRTGQEMSVVRELNTWHRGMAVYPEKEKLEYRNNRWEKLRKPLLRGYIFLFAQPSLDISRVNRLNGVLRVLSYDDGQCNLLGTDRAFADWIWAQEGVVTLSKAVKEGDHVEIIDGPLINMKGAIVMIDKRKRIAKVDLSLVGSSMRIWLSFDYIELAYDKA